jgi:hypothetical protein
MLYKLEDGSQVKDIPVNYTGWLVTAYGIKAWYRHGKLHRLYGPAIEYYR